MAYFQKKPSVIQAERLTLDSFSEVSNWAGTSCCPGYKDGKRVLIIHTLEGDMTARLGDWVVKGIKGEFYPCKHEIFIELHDELPDYEPEQDS